MHVGQGHTTRNLRTRNALTRRRFAASIGASLVSLSFANVAATGRSSVNVFNWNDYIGNNTLADFSRHTDVDVNYYVYDNVERMLTKLQSSDARYDVVFPSDYAVESMINLGMLEPLRHAELTNMAHIDARFLNPSFDPGCRYSLPYFWGSLGIGYRKSVVTSPPSWKDLFDSDEYTGRIALLSDSRLVLALSLLYLGHSPNSTDSGEIAAARDLLVRQKKHLRALAPHSGQDLLLSREVDLAMEWNGDLQNAMQADDDIAFVVPPEGSILWVDGICIPKGAPNIDDAHQFINFLHAPEINAEISETVRFATSNKAARLLIREDDRKNPAIYLPEPVLARCRSLVDIGVAVRIYDQAWRAVEAA